MPLIETKGAASAQGFGEFLQQSAPIYIENVFSTYLYTGNNSTQTITNGIDLSGKGGLLWAKMRAGGVEGNCLFDSARGTNQLLNSNNTNNNLNLGAGGPTFLSSGFSLTNNTSFNGSTSQTYVSWTFRKQPKFFDVVTYTGTGSAGMINHNLGSTPGMIIYKSTSLINNWCVYHRSISPTSALFLNLTIAQDSGSAYFGSQSATATQFPVGLNDLTNQNGQTYVAYLFAHNAGGFGLTGSDNAISCGSVTADSSGNATVNLGYEPQWVLMKSSSGTNNWAIIDNMRGFQATDSVRFLFPNNANAEAGGGLINLNSTGFYSSATLSANATYIYIAIRRGPMKVPTSGTSVFSPVRQAGGGTVTTNFVVDASITKDIAVSAVGDNFVWDRLRGSANGSLAAKNLITNSTAAESAGSVSAAVMNVSNTAVTDSFYGSGYNVIYWNFRRAPKFFDVVCYTGNGVQTARNHNLGVVPEFMMLKRRSFPGGDWDMSTGYGVSTYSRSALPYTVAFTTLSYGTGVTYGAAPTATTFTTSQDAGYNGSGYTYVAYLFASCPGVSKVGTYTGTGALQTINCGFTGGARFVLIKRTDSTGDWYVYDSARGISSGNDPYLFLNTTAAEVTGTNYVDTTSVGFQVTAAAPAGLNANGGTYIFLAIA
jgi:hypothetical protein